MNCSAKREIANPTAPPRSVKITFSTMNCPTSVHEDAPNATAERWWSHHTRERFEVSFDRAVHLVIPLRIGELHLFEPRLELFLDRREVRRGARLIDRNEITHQFIAIGLGLRRADRDPDVGEGNLAQVGHIGDHTDHAESLAVNFNRLAEGRLVAEEFPARRLVDDGDVVLILLVIVCVRPAFEEVEFEDLPEHAIGAFDVRLDLLAAPVRIDFLGLGEEQHLLDAGQVARVAVEEAIAACAVPSAVSVGGPHLQEIDAERALLLVLRRLFAKDMVEKRHRHHQHHQGEADGEQTDEGEEFPPEEHFECDLEVVFEHSFQLTCRPSNSRTMRSVFSAWPESCVTITTVVLSFLFRSLSTSIISSPIWLSRLPVGSSASRMRGLPTMARAMATRCC